MTLQSFPSLQDDRTSVGLTLCSTALDASTMLKRGIRRLLLLTEDDRIRRQIDHLPRLKELEQLGKCIPGFQCADQLKVLLVERAYLSAPEVPRSKAAFEQFKTDGRKRIGFVVQEIQQLLPGLLRHTQQTVRDLNGVQIPQSEGLVNGMKNQLAQLVYATFLEDTPWPWLIQYGRYFDGIRVRLDRLASGGLQKELTLDRDFQRYLVRYRSRQKKHAAAGREDAMMVHYRWLLEEFRVSLFAPKLGTAVKVSGGKLDEVWNSIPV